MSKNWHDLAIQSKFILKQALDLKPNEAWPYIIFADNYCSSCEERFAMLLKAWQIDPTNTRCEETLASLSKTSFISNSLKDQYNFIKTTHIDIHKKYAIPIKCSIKKELENKINFSIENQRINLHENQHYNTILDFIIDNKWNLNLGYSHEFLAGDQTFVYGAGCITIDRISKKIIYIDNKSGHFQPNINKFNSQILQYFKLFYDVSKISIMYYDTSSHLPICCGVPSILLL
jgi:hypothetical protein